MKVCIFDIKRFALHDGPGIRTTVFFKGCPLECRWCHNPEGIPRDIERFTEEITFDGVRMQKQVEVGRWAEAGELMDELERDRIYMEESGGGVSFSGGEPLMQPDALFSLLEMSRERKLHTTVDTSGHASAEDMDRVSEKADLILYDLKTLNDEMHRKYTGVSCNKILRNLERIVEGPAEVIIRIPVVPGFNDRQEDMGTMIDYLGGLKRIKAVDILPFHPYGMHKYRKFKREARQDGFKVPAPEQIEKIRDMFSDAGFTVRVGG
jgi:pyruvate formate lyase activating enzyme